MSKQKLEAAKDEKKLLVVLEYANKIGNKVNEFIQYSANKNNGEFFENSENFKHLFWLEVMLCSDN